MVWPRDEPARSSSCWRARASFAAYRGIQKQRATARARAMRQLEQNALAGQLQAVATVMAMSVEDMTERRVVGRALGKWRGSTLHGYLLEGDDQTCKDNTPHRLLGSLP